MYLWKHEGETVVNRQTSWGRTCQGIHDIDVIMANWLFMLWALEHIENDFALFIYIYAYIHVRASSGATGEDFDHHWIKL